MLARTFDGNQHVIKDAQKAPLDDYFVYRIGGLHNGPISPNEGRCNGIYFSWPNETDGRIDTREAQVTTLALA